MKALVFNRYGGPDQLAFADIPRPAFKPDQLLVQVHAAGLNPIDNMIPKGTFRPILMFELPATLGSDLAGTVVEVGSRSHPVQTGRCCVRQHLRPRRRRRSRRICPRARKCRCAQAVKPGLRVSRVDPNGRVDIVASAEGACRPQTRQKGVHSRRFRRNWHLCNSVCEVLGASVGTTTSTLI